MLKRVLAWGTVGVLSGCATVGQYEAMVTVSEPAHPGFTVSAGHAPGTGATVDAISDATDAIQGRVDSLEDAIANGGFPGPARAELQRQKLNLQAVLTALAGATLQIGDAGGATGETDFATDPPTVTVDEEFADAPTAAIAQILAHEAIHLIDGDPANNSVDGELRCFKKEAEVWDALKKPGDKDESCQTTSDLAGRGEAALRAAIRAAYPELPEKAPR